MFRDRRLTRGPPGRDREKFPSSRFSGPGGAGRWSSGRVGKPYVTKSAVDRKADTAKFRLAGRGALNQNRNKKIQKGEKSEAAKTEDAQLYRQKMQISPDPYRKCVDNEVELIQEALLDALEPLEDGCYPQFYGSYMVKGALVISCANEQSKKWLEKIVPTLVPWEGGKLCVKPKGDIVQGTQVVLKTPKLFAKTEPKKILQMLNTQNKTLDTNQWKNISVKSEDSGQTLVYVVDNQSLEAIRALDNKVYLGLGNVELVIVKNEEEEDGKETSEDTEMTPPEKAASEKAASEKAASEKAASEKAASEKAAPEKAAPEKAAPEKAAPEKAAPEKAAPEKAAPEKAAPEKAAPEKAAPEKAAPEKAASEKAASEKVASEETPSEKPPTVKTESE